MDFTPKNIQPTERPQPRPSLWLAKAVKAQLEQFRIQIARLIYLDVVEYLNTYNLGSVSWLQYTPYFNDGDTCEFSVNLDYCNISDKVAPISALRADGVACMYMPFDQALSLTRRAEARIHQVMTSGDPADEDGNGVDSIVAIANTFDWNRENAPAFRSQQDALRSLFREVPDMVMQVLGEHAAVYVDRSGLYVQDYKDHD